MPESLRANFASFYRATLTPLRRYLARMVRNHGDAEDLAHDAYLRVYEAMDGQHVERPEAFLFTTARRLALNQIKRRQTTPVQNGDGAKIIEFAAAGGPGVERMVMARQEWARMEPCRLPLSGAFCFWKSGKPNAGLRQRVVPIRSIVELSIAESGN